MTRTMPIPGETWRPRSDAPDLDSMPVSIYVTGIDMERGFVFGIPAYFEYEGGSLRWTVAMFLQFMERELK